MDTRRITQTAAKVTIGAFALLTLATTSPTQSTGDTTPVRVLDGVQLHEPNPQRAEMLDWAIKRYRAAGLQVPAVDVYFHDDDGECGGYLGFTKNGRVDLCIRLAMEGQPQRIVLHELAHAWAEVELDDDTRNAFIELRTLGGWNVTADDHKDRGTEQAAEIIAWGLGEAAPQPLISGDTTPSALADGFRLLTGAEPLNGTA
jgi:hypothetical protein